MSILVVGSVAYDTVETPSGRADDALGGSATFFATAASLFTSTRLVAVVGEDFREQDLDFLRTRRADLAGVRREAGRTFRWGGRYHASMNHRDTLFTELNVFESFSPEIPTAWRDSEYVFLGNIAPELQLRVLEQVRSPRFVACDTMNFWIQGQRDAVVHLLSRVDALIINDEEALMLSGAHTVIAAAARIQQMGPKTVIIKRGEHGALMFNNGDTFYTPAYPLEVVVDPTGAGDTFAGGFMGWLASTGDLSGASMRRAVVTGTLMASFSVEGFSVDRLKTVDRDQLLARYRELATLTRFESLDL